MRGLANIGKSSISSGIREIYFIDTEELSGSDWKLLANIPNFDSNAVYIINFELRSGSSAYNKLTIDEEFEMKVNETTAGSTKNEYVKLDSTGALWGRPGGYYDTQSLWFRLFITDNDHYITTPIS